MKELMRKSNKGVAIITVMIAVLFLSVIATSMLYISASNYAMKAANVMSKENFYETDAILVKTTSNVRQSVYKSVSDNEDASELGDLLVTAPSTTSAGEYDISEIAKLVYPSNIVTSGASKTVVELPKTVGSEKKDKIIFQTTPNVNGNGVLELATKDTDSTIPSGVYRYTFKDVEIVQTSADGFNNSVKTDIVFDIYEEDTTGGGAGGVGNMSMLLDSSVKIDASNFANLTLSGNTFIVDYSSTELWNGKKYISPGTDALVMSSHSRLNMCGSNNVVYGDLKLSGDACLALYGDLTVFGDINVTGNATIILSDDAKIYQIAPVSTGSCLPGRGLKCECNVPIKNIYCQSSSTTADPMDSTKKVFKPEYVTQANFVKFAQTIGVEGTATDAPTDYGLINKIFKKGVNNGRHGSGTKFIDGRLTDLSIDSNDDNKLNFYDHDILKSYSAGDAGGKGVMLNKEVMGSKFGIGVIKKGADTSSLNADYSNRLMLSFNEGDTKPVVLQESTPFTTWICKSPVKCSQAHCVVISKVGTEQFNYMTAAKKDDDSKIFDTENNPFNNIHMKLDGKDFNGDFGSFFNKDCNKTVDDMFNYSKNDESSGGKDYPADTIYFSNYSRDCVDDL